MRINLLLLLSSGGLVAPRREGLVVNRRARQRARQPLADQEPALTSDTEDLALVSNLDNADLGYSPTRDISDFGYSERVGYDSRASLSDSYGYNTRRSQSRARARTRAPTSSDSGEPSTLAPRAASESRRIRVRSRMRARLPRRQSSQLVEEKIPPANVEQKELYRDERTIVASEAPTRSRSRSRSRHRLSIPSREVPTTESYSEQRVVSARLSRGRVRERGRDVEKKYTSVPRIQDSYSSRRLSASSRDKEEPSRAQRPKEPSRASQSSPRIRFPKKNLFGTKAKTYSSSRDNSIESSPRSLAKTSPRLIAKGLVKGRASTSRSRGRGEDIQPSKPTRTRGSLRDREEESQHPELQSSQREVERDVPTAITVTHQVPSRTVFTVVENGETKSLFADTFKSSLEVVAVSDLKSTEINSHRVVYAHVQTNIPSFGVTEMEFEAIQPTRTYRDEERSARVGGVDTQVVEQIPYTVYNVEKITARVTNTPTVAVGNLGLEALSDPGQLGALLQNVLLSILGGGLLGAGGATVHKGPQKTELITHTRSFLTTITSLETIKIPVNFRGSTIFQTVTEEKTDLVTVTDYSVQTVLNYQSQSQPFLPLAPTLHRAARVVPASPPPLNILPILHTSPPHLQTSLLTQTETVTETVTTLATSQILLTLGGRAITTEIVEPVTQVVTSTVLSTQSVVVAEAQKATSPTRSLRQLQLLQAILGLRRS